MSEQTAKILNDRLHQRITDAEAVVALVRTGKSKRAARDMLRFQDELFGEDCIEVDEENAFLIVKITFWELLALLCGAVLCGWMAREVFASPQKPKGLAGFAQLPPEPTA